ncbi:MAG TPA: hypothetical protein VN924_12990 [Bryobacteraceae bacterium]|jgi:hypothetical protein|nr:hypothetical protein [Bryobacteraceae bacterium]
MEIGGHKADLAGFGGYGCDACALQRLRAGMIHLEYGGIFESVQSPGARVEARAKDHQLSDGCGGGNGTVQNHRPKID